MDGRLLILSVATAVIFVVAPFLLLGMLTPCGPSSCAAPGWLYDFQTLVAGILAIDAAFLAVSGALILDRLQDRRRVRTEEQAHIAQCVNAGTALLPYVHGIREVAELAIAEAQRAAGGIAQVKYEPLRVAIPLTEERCAEARRLISNVPITLHQKLLGLLNEFEILLFKARIAVAYGSTHDATLERQLTGLQDVQRRAIKLQETLNDWGSNPG